MDHPEQPHQRTITNLLTSVTLSEGHRPLLTCYDNMTGARTELSYATLDNWAAKTANLLGQEYSVGAGATVLMDLDGHWTTAVLTLACWKVGAVPLSGLSRSPAEPVAALVCCHERHVDRYPDGPLLVVGDGLAAEPLTDVAPRRGLTLLGEEVHAFADDYEGEVAPSTPALIPTHQLTDARPGGVDHATVLTWAEAWRDLLGGGARVGLATSLDHPRAADLLAGILMARGSLVADRPPAHPPRWDRWSTEHVTVAVGPAEVVADAPSSVEIVGFDAVATGG